MMSATLVALFLAATASNHLPPGLLQAICWTESGGNTDAVNRADRGGPSLGVCQVQKRTAALLGFKGTEKELLRPATNVKWAARILRYQMTRYRGNVVKAVAAYNAGRYRRGKDGLPLNKKYVLRVLRAHREHR